MMIWEPEDWGIGRDDRQERAATRDELFRTICPFLARIPERGAQRVAVLDRHAVGLRTFLAAHFSEVVVLPLDRLESDLPSRRGPASRRQFDVIVAPRPTGFHRVSDLDCRLEAWFANLSEGGLIVAAFPATGRSDGVAAIPLVHRDENRSLPCLHEVELQYRLHRAGFLGLRMRRFDTETEGSVLVCTAVRRANN